MLDIQGMSVLKDYRFIRKIDEGYSGDDKYLLEKDGIKYLLRVGAKAERERSQGKKSALLESIQR